MSRRHKDEVADHFAASRKSVSSSKKLFPPNQPQIKAINSILGDARRVWEYLTIGYTKKGVRLIRKDQLDWFIQEFDELEVRLAEALNQADEQYDEIMDNSREWLQDRLFDPNDYPASFAGSVSLRWSVHNFEPSEELLQLAPETYAREQLRVRQQFESAIIAYEDECRSQMADLIGSLLYALRSEKDGKRQIFKEATANNLRDFFQRFKSMGITSDASLAELIAEAEDALGGTTMRTLKNSSVARNGIASAFKDVAQKLNTLIVDAPTRSISLDELE